MKGYSAFILEKKPEKNYLSYQKALNFGKIKETLPRFILLGKKAEEELYET
ncbi:MAG: hypothetical protein L0K95_01390 [Tetragenococcus koreensis]|uniref:Uncharacterized protein n=1 Tax=Tetragenococcus koreensis TaxID=290335 RepID=A0AAN4RJE0_9ENTE|nr:hypothetical protein [Tetragenococcus koreensis]MCF1656200.1 hypothetical protein [Tetragenococcus koreensis]MDN6164638.1 hypothetical protein [Tetragenococcus koreensis]MDN6290663.1 hypothetical protein [Tetragenococcus koreensis]MDN6345164.1 hypothetical protein [Tetragenococcus koreensis]MDN6540408.1 hypothetical protein [Tetragenococcus koreensis]